MRNLLVAMAGLYSYTAVGYEWRYFVSDVSVIEYCNCCILFNGIIEDRAYSFILLML